MLRYSVIIYWFLVLLKRNFCVQQNSPRKNQNSNEPECNRKGLMGCPAILLTLINNLGTIGTWFSSPSHIIYPIPLPPLSFGSLRSLVSFRTRRAWEWLVFARLACFSWKQKDVLEKQCYFFLSRSTVKNCVFWILVAQSVSVVAQYVLSSDCDTNSLFTSSSQPFI